MFDIHYHLIPNVDDGPDTIGCALDMVKISYDQGVRAIVATPHLYHPAEFRGEVDIKRDMHQEFEDLRMRIQASYPEMEIYLGAEVYLSREDLKHLDQVKMTTMNNTHYVLVEFSRDLTYQELEHALQALMALGYRPILAHAEVYKCFTNQMEDLLKLRDQGVLIQCSAGNILDFRKRPEKIRAVEMMRQGLVDIIASNGHNLNTSRPDLAKAYTYIAKKYGAQEAERLFVENPKTILEDGLVAQPKRDPLPSLGFKKSWVLIASIIILAIITRCS